jgi:hypothetical protein
MLSNAYLHRLQMTDWTGDGKHLPARVAAAIRYLERAFGGSPRTRGGPSARRQHREIWTATDERGPKLDDSAMRCRHRCPASEKRLRALTRDFGMQLHAVQMGLPILRLPADRFQKAKQATDGPE